LARKNQNNQRRFNKSKRGDGREKIIRTHIDGIQKENSPFRKRNKGKTKYKGIIREKDWRTST
jgi:hypothetical protein